MTLRASKVFSGFLLPTLLLLASVVGTIRAEETEFFEFKAVALGKDEAKASKRLNDLMRDGWEIAGVLGNNLTAFRRKIVDPTKSPSDKPLEIPEPPKAPEAPEVPKASESPETMKTPETLIVPEVPKVPEPPKVPELPKATDDAPAKSLVNDLNVKAASAESMDVPAMMPIEKPAVSSLPAVEAPALPEISKLNGAGSTDSSTPKPKLSEDDEIGMSILKQSGPEELPQVAMSSLPEPKGPVTGDPKKGTWELVTYALNGQTIRQQDTRCTWTVDGDHWISRWVTAKGETQVAEGTLKVRSEKEGATIVDLVHTEGDYKGRTTFAIMASSGDFVKYCYSADENKRPENFVTSQGDHRGLVLWKKVK